MRKLQSNTGHFLAEGRTNLAECLRLSFDRAAKTGITTVVIFTINGDGLEFACRNFLNEPRFKDIRVIGVGLPFGSAPPSALQVPDDRAKLLEEFKIPILRAASPLDDPPVLNKGQHLVRKTLEIFSGGMALCVWGALVACDAGVVQAGEHVVSCCADTSIIAKAVPTSHFFSSFVVREIVCKPLIHDISKNEALAEELGVEELPKASPVRRQVKRLPEGQIKS